MNERYQQRGVSADKEEVHQAIKNLDKGLYPNAFCKILPDLAAGSAEYANVMHADTAGTKASLAYLYWKETGDESVWKGIAQDALIMNIDDLICVGALDNIIISSTIGRNKNKVDGASLSKMINGMQELIEELNELGLSITLAGGETADVGDIVRTVDYGVTAFSRIRRTDVIEVNLKPGDSIIGLASFGQTNYEKEYNSGIGSNGLTSARHDVLSKYYKENYTEAFDPEIPDNLCFSGNNKLSDIEPETGLAIGKLLLSPTRTYAPFIKKLLSRANRDAISGIIHCSGGAQTKVLKFANNVHIIKNNLFDTPPIFKLIQENSGTAWKEMYKVFNMGHRLELYVNPRLEEEIFSIASHFNIEAKKIGHVKESHQTALTIESPYGTYDYFNS